MTLCLHTWSVRQYLWLSLMRWSTRFAIYNFFLYMYNKNKYLLIKKFKSKNYEATFMARKKFFLLMWLTFYLIKKLCSCVTHLEEQNQSIIERKKLLMPCHVTTNTHKNFHHAKHKISWCERKGHRQLGDEEQFFLYCWLDFIIAINLWNFLF